AYSYACNNPVNATDPSGLSCQAGAQSGGNNKNKTGTAPGEGVGENAGTGAGSRDGCDPDAPNTAAALPAGPRPIAEIGPAGNPGAFRPSAPPNFSNPAQSPGAGWQWRGTGPPGSRQGSWHNPQTGESLHPDLSHRGPIGAHYDYRAPNGVDYRVYPDGRIEPK
ncbi:MAG: hypothetical protein ACRDQ2_10105, partial [Gaiellales bacterium]